MKRKRNPDFEKVARLIPLRMTGDLNVEDARRVDETVRYDAETKSELESFTRTIAILQEAAEQPLSHESAVVRGEHSLWDRIEPRLGPVGKMRPSGFSWVPTRYLAAACLLLAVLTLATESGRVLVFPAPVPGGVEPARNAMEVPPSPPRVQVNIDPNLYRWLQSTDSQELSDYGLLVIRINRLVQLRLKLQDLNGVVVANVKPGSIADLAGLQIGDCITSVNGQPVYAPKHLREKLDEAKGSKSILLDLIRKQQSQKTPMSIGSSEVGQSFLSPRGATIEEQWSWPTTS